jgi:hypothetical protein
MKDQQMTVRRVQVQMNNKRDGALRRTWELRIDGEPVEGPFTTKKAALQAARTIIGDAEMVIERQQPRKQYTRTHRHNLPEHTLRLVQDLIERGVSKLRTAMAAGISRLHVHRLVKQYGWKPKVEENQKQDVP